MLKTETGKTKTAKKTTATVGAPRKRAATTAVAKQSVPLPVDAAARRQPSQEEIASRAYELYLERGGRDGSAIEDWFEAERQLRSNNGRLVDAAPRKR